MIIREVEEKIILTQLQRGEWRRRIGYTGTNFDGKGVPPLWFPNLVWAGHLDQTNRMRKVYEQGLLEGNEVVEVDVREGKLKAPAFGMVAGYWRFVGNGAAGQECFVAMAPKEVEMEIGLRAGNLFKGFDEERMLRPSAGGALGILGGGRGEAEARTDDATVPGQLRGSAGKGGATVI